MSERLPVSGIVFVDLDSTLSNSLQRQHLINRDWSKTDWEAYAMASVDDEVFTGVVVAVRALAREHTIVIVTGRNISAHDITATWLATNGVPYDMLIMRPRGDERPNEELKLDLMQQYLDITERAAPALVVDDWPPLAPHLEKRGWPLLLVNPNYPVPDAVERALDDVWMWLDNAHGQDCSSLEQEVLTYPQRCNCRIAPVRAAYERVSGYLRRYET